MNLDKDVFVPEKTFAQSFSEWLDWLPDEQKAALFDSGTPGPSVLGLILLTAAATFVAAVIVTFVRRLRSAP